MSKDKKSKEVFVSVGTVSVNKKDVEAAYQKSMPKVVEKLICSAIGKAKSKGLTTKKPGGDDSVVQLSPRLELLKNIGKGKELKIRGEVSIGMMEVKGKKILDKLTTITKGATVILPAPPPKKLDGEFAAAVEAAATDCIDSVIKRMLK